MNFCQMVLKTMDSITHALQIGGREVHGLATPYPGSALFWQEVYVQSDQIKAMLLHPSAFHVQQGLLL